MSAKPKGRRAPRRPPPRRRRGATPRPKARGGWGTPAHTCGQLGGRNADGTACPRPADWGVPKRDRRAKPGLCRDHRPDHAARVQRAKQAFLELLATGDVDVKVAAWRAARVDQATIWRWRQADPTFDEGVQLALAAYREIRCARLEDSAYNRAVRGQAAAGLEIFLLKNYSGGRLRDRHEVTGADGGPLLPVETLQQILGED